MTKSKGKYYLVGGEHDMDDYEKRMDEFIKIFRDIDPQQDLALKYISKEEYIRKIKKIVDDQYKNLKKRGGTRTADYGSSDEEDEDEDEIPSGPRAAIEEEEEEEDDEEDDSKEIAYDELTDASTYVRRVEAIKTFLGNTITSLYDAALLDRSDDELREEYDIYSIRQGRRQVEQIIESLKKQPMLFLKNNITDVTDIKDGKNFKVRQNICNNLPTGRIVEGKPTYVSWDLNKEKGYVTEELASPLLNQLVPGVKSSDVLTFFNTTLQFADFDVEGKDIVIDVKSNPDFGMYCDRAKIEKMPYTKQGYICWPWNTRRGTENPNRLDLNQTGIRDNRYNDRLLMLKVPNNVDDRMALLGNFIVENGLIFFGKQKQKFTPDMFMVKTETKFEQISDEELRQLKRDIKKFGPGQI
jgi:hypothetical protein